MTNFVDINGGEAPTTWRGHYDQGMRLMAMAEGHPEVLPLLAGAQANMTAALVKYIEAEEKAYEPKPQPEWQRQNDMLWEARTAASVQEFTAQHGCTPEEYLAQHPLPPGASADPVNGAQVEDLVASSQQAVASATVSEPFDQVGEDAK